MHRREALKLFAGLALCPLCAPKGFAADAHWSYEGAEGPAKWGELDPANKACSVGVQQSPINIGETIKAQLPPLKMTWAKTAESIVNNGHTIQVNMGESSTIAVGGGGNFRLVQFHFHRPSEHTVNGASFPMEVHFVHANAAGNLAVVGVLMTTGRVNKVLQHHRPDHAEPGRPAGRGRSEDRSERFPAGEAQLLSLLRLAHDAAVRRDGRLARAHRPDPGGGGRHQQLRPALSDERASGAEGQSALRAALDLGTAAPPAPADATGE